MKKAILAVVVTSLSLMGCGEEEKPQNIDKTTTPVAKTPIVAAPLVAAPVASTVVPTKDVVIKSGKISNNKIVAVEDENLISLDSQAIDGLTADKMMVSAIMENNLDKVKFYIKSGVNMAFTDTSMCGFDDGFRNEFDLPNTPKVMKESLMVNQIQSLASTITTHCDKAFLLHSVKNMYRTEAPEAYDYYFYNRKDNRKELEGKKIEIYNYLRSQMPAKDTYQLINVALYDKAPYSIRQEALNTVLKVEDKPSENRANFLNLYRKTVEETTSNNKSYSVRLMELNTPWSLYIQPLVFQYLNKGQDYERDLNFKERSIENDKKYNPGKNFGILPPHITVNALRAGKVEHVQDSTSALSDDPRNPNKMMQFKELYELNNAIALLNTVIKSKKLDLNVQDAEGNTLLHNLMTFNTGLGKEKARAMASLVRYLLEEGANPNLLNKKGKTANMLVQEQLANGGREDYQELANAFTNKNFN